MGFFFSLPNKHNTYLSALIAAADSRPVTASYYLRSFSIGPVELQPVSPAPGSTDFLHWKLFIFVVDQGFLIARCPFFSHMNTGIHIHQPHSLRTLVLALTRHTRARPRLGAWVDAGAGK